MLKRAKVIVFVVTLAAMILSLSAAAYSAPGRWERNLAGGEWFLWLDEDAEWIEDELFAPPVDISSLPVNPPTCGWDLLNLQDRLPVTVPGTVEQYKWSRHGNFVGTAGDYRGVSWWSTTFELDPSLRGKRILIAFESVNLRAEVFVNHELVGYDLVGNTPFTADATDAVDFNGVNRLDVRITDAGGNFSWPAHIIFPWGEHMIPIVRGFSGVTGNVVVRALDAVAVADIYVRNTPKITDVDVFATLDNASGAVQKGDVTLTIHEYGDPDAVVWKKTVSADVPADGAEIEFTVRAPKAKPWGILDPNLYTASVTFVSSDGRLKDTMKRRFGFRWFDIGEKNGDQRLYLNGRRVFMMANVHRGYWATNGIFPTPEMAKKDVEIAIAMGFNSIAYHNAIGHQLLVRYADEYGMLSTGESAGYRINDRRGRPWPDELTRDLRREKLIRFVRRDRSFPSLIAYMLKNEDGNAPDDDDMRNIAIVRDLDPTRILLYTGDCDRARREHAGLDINPLKLFYKPNDPKDYWYGWFDKHHWNRYAGYMDDWCYRNPRNYMRLNSVDGDSTTTVDEGEIIFYGEEGAFGTMLTLGRIRSRLYEQGSADGWREGEHIDWYDAYERFLDESGFRSSYPTVDDLTTALGANMHYFHGRIVENARMSNVIDAYNLNGWSAAATHTDLVDAYRNPTGDPSCLAYYNQPLYVAVKLRDKVMPVGNVPVADIFLVNEVDLKGKYTLALDLVAPDGSTAFSGEYDVRITGGEEYGQLLVEEVVLPKPGQHGYYKLNARIVGRKGVACTGFDEFFSVDWKNGPGVGGTVAVIDTSGVISAFLGEARGIGTVDFETYDHGYSGPQVDYIVVGAHDFGGLRRTLYGPVMEQVANGATLVVVDGADGWAEQWNDLYSHQAIQYNGSQHWGGRGRLFLGKSSLLTGLPKARSMNWEYQVFYRGDVWGIDMNRRGNEVVVALAGQHRKDILTAVARIPFGRGTIIVSTLNMMDNLASETPQSAIAKRLFMNYLEYANE